MANNLPDPETRKEMFLASAAGMPVEVPTPITREEVFLDAIAKGGGVSPDDAYTKAQTDALLASKVDKEIGKGLSTNDFTDTDKANLTTALTKANAASPQATTYTKTEVDTALAAKLNTADVDDTLSETSANPVQNRVVHASVARLVDAGAKNLMPLNTVTFLSAGVGDEFSATIPKGNYVLSCNCTATSSTSHLYLFDANHNEILHQPFTNSTDKKINLSLTSEADFVRFDSDIQNTISNIMLCTAEDYKISPEFVPYVPTMLELYQMIQALQTGGVE